MMYNHGDEVPLERYPLALAAWIIGLIWLWVARKRLFFRTASTAFQGYGYNAWKLIFQASRRIVRHSHFSGSRKLHPPDCLLFLVFYPGQTGLFPVRALSA
jgi:hypothetical protein